MAARVASSNLAVRSWGKRGRNPRSARCARGAERLRMLGEAEEAKLQALKVLGRLNLKRELLTVGVLTTDGKNLRLNIRKDDAKLAELQPGDVVLCYLIKLNAEPEEEEEGEVEE